MRSSTATAGLPRPGKRLLQRDQRLRTWGLRSLLAGGYGLSDGDGEGSRPEGANQHRR